MHIGLKIRDYRKSLENTQREFSNIYGNHTNKKYDQKYLSAIETGRQKPTEEFLKAVDEAFETNFLQQYKNEHPDYQIEWQDDKPVTVDQMIIALTKFRDAHGGKGRVSLFFLDEELGEIIPYQPLAINNHFYDYEKGDVCNIEITQ